MKNISRFVAILLILCMTFAFCANCVYASDWGESVWGERQKLNGKDDTGTSDKVKKIVGNIAVVVKIVAVATAVIILIVLGAKYMMAAPGDKADIKKSMIPFVIGAFVVFAATSIVEMLIKFSAQLGG